MKAWACRHNGNVAIWRHDDKPDAVWFIDRQGKRFFILRGQSSAIDESYGENTHIEHKIGRRLKEKEILEINWE